MYYNVDLFMGTGFNSVDIPSNPGLPYSMANNHQCEIKSYENINLVQDDWEANILLADITPEEARKVDYVIIIDSDHYNDTHDAEWIKYATCYTVKNYSFQSETTCKFNLLLDPYNTMGGFEFVNNQGKTYNTVIAGSANRLSVPLTKYTDYQGHTEDDAGYEHYASIYPKREDKDFFTLEEPFQPSTRVKKNSQQPTPPVKISDLYIFKMGQLDVQTPLSVTLNRFLSWVKRDSFDKINLSGNSTFYTLEDANAIMSNPDNFIISIEEINKDDNNKATALRPPTGGEPRVSSSGHHFLFISDRANLNELLYIDRFMKQGRINLDGWLQVLCDSASTTLVTGYGGFTPLSTSLKAELKVKLKAIWDDYILYLERVINTVEIQGWYGLKIGKMNIPLNSSPIITNQGIQIPVDRKFIIAKNLSDSDTFTILDDTYVY